MPHPTAGTSTVRTALLASVLGLLAGLLLAAPALAQPRGATHIVQLRPGTSPTAARAIVRAAGGRVTGTLSIIDAVAAELPGSAVVALARDPHVAAVSANAGVRPQAADVMAPLDSSSTAAPDATLLKTAYPASVLAPSAWGATTGRGVGVAVIDTGIAGQMPDFAAADGSSRVVASVVTSPDATTASDSYGHGTHVAGIIAGNGARRPSTDPLAGRYVGIAPDADLISVKVGDDAGNATVLDVINGLQFVVDHQAELNIRVVNLSLESTTPESYRTNALDAAVEAAWFHGIVVVAAAGNRGSDPAAADYAPGNDPYVITVGAIDDQSTDTLADDAYASWSSVGTSQDGNSKPEIGAPGAHIVSTLAPGSEFERLCSTCVVDGDYIRAGGTSMAAPVVSGVAALMLQLHPTWTPDEIKATIVATRRQVPGLVEEVNAQAATAAADPAPAANTGLVPNDLVDPATGAIDYARSSWSRSSWSAAPNPLTAGWARSSWSCNCSQLPDGSVDPARSSWSRSSWSTKWIY